MHKLNLNKEKKLEHTKLEILLLTEIGIFRILKRKIIRFDIRPFFKAIFFQKKKPITSEENHVDLHLDIVKKLDESISKNEIEMNNKDPEPVIKTKNQPPLSDKVEIREPLTRTLDTPFINEEITPKGVLSEMDKIEEFYEFEHPINASPEIQQLKDDDFYSWVKVEEDKKSKKLFWDLIKTIVSAKSKEIKKVETNPKINNNVIKTKKELEKTKQEIEVKKRELEMVMQKEQEKELELKKIEEEKKKQEKLRQIELKKKLKEKQFKEKETKKIEKKRKKEKQLELKKIQEEKRKQEKLAQIELKKKLREKQPELKKQKKQKTKKEKFQLFRKKEVETKPIITDTHEKEKTKLEEPIEWDEDVEKLIPIIDNLLEKLPDEVIDEFAQSEDFNLYEKVILKYKNK